MQFFVDATVKALQALTKMQSSRDDTGALIKLLQDQLCDLALVVCFVYKDRALLFEA